MVDGKPGVFNPLDRVSLGEAVANALLQQPVRKLPPPGSRCFAGVGIYAIYYVGTEKPYTPYEPIAAENRGDRFSQPIYVGRAEPPGARKGLVGIEDVDAGRELCDRLRSHARSINQVGDTLSLDDFYCRYLVVDDIWIPLGENLLIRRFRPIWNQLIDGFGNHDPGEGREKTSPSKWDTLHEGRPWVAKLKGAKRDANEILADLAKFLRGEEVTLISAEEAMLNEADQAENAEMIVGEETEDLATDS